MSTKKTAEERAEAKYPNSIKYGLFDSVSNIQFRKVYATCIREEVEPLEAWKESAIKVMGEWNKAWIEEVEPRDAEIERLRALVHELVNALAGHANSCAATDDDATMMTACTCGLYRRQDHALSAAKEQGFVPTNTEDNG